MIAGCHSWVADSKTDIMLGYQGSFNFRFGGRPHSVLLLSLTICTEGMQLLCGIRRCSSMFKPRF